MSGENHTVRLQHLTFIICHVVNPARADLKSGSIQTFPSVHYQPISHLSHLEAHFVMLLPSHRVCAHNGTVSALVSEEIRKELGKVNILTGRL
jgi:hypothetical protein